MPALSNASDYDDEDNIIAEYERRDSGTEQDTENRNAGSENDEESQDKNTARRVDPSTSKRTVMRNSLPKLNTERLKGPKGIQTIEKYFEGFKFHGKGNEKLDLDGILKRMEHWGHRLFPKLEFDSFLERLEKLGSRRDLQVFIRKYRQDMIRPDDDAMNQDVIDDDNEMEQDEPIDEFDLLIAEQIQKQKQVNQQSSDTSTADALFDKLMLETNNKASQQSQPLKENTGPSQLSDEVKEHIERNRQQALLRRQARLKVLEEEAKRKKLEESNDTEYKNSFSNAHILSDTPSLGIEDSHKVENEKEEDREI